MFLFCEKNVTSHPMKNFDINKIKSLLSNPKKIVIVPHRNPDGDAMGSTLGLYHFLLKLNHEVVVISPNEFPDFLNWLPAADKVLIYEKHKSETTKIINEAEDGDFYNEKKKEFEKALAELPEKQRTVLLMNKMGGLTYSEIAESLGLSNKAIEKRMGQALKTLKTNLGAS